MIRLKEGVRVHGIQPEIVFAIAVARDVWLRHSADELVVTSVIDGKHARPSFHYSGSAVDFRIHNVPQVYRAAAVIELKERLGPDYEVIHESVGEPNEHVHVHFRPREPYSG